MFIYYKARRISIDHSHFRVWTDLLSFVTVKRLVELACLDRLAHFCYSEETGRTCVFGQTCSLLLQ